MKNTPFLKTTLFQMKNMLSERHENMDVTAPAKKIIYLIALFIVRKRIAFFVFSARCF